jgi:hypothetical protein
MTQSASAPPADTVARIARIRLHPLLYRMPDSHAYGMARGLTAARGKTAQDIESATQITTASDLKNRRYYFHTMNSREVRMIDLAKIDFGAVREQMIDGDEGRRHTVREITIRPSGAVR